MLMPDPKKTRWRYREMSRAEKRRMDIAVMAASALWLMAVSVGFMFHENSGPWLQVGRIDVGFVVLGGLAIGGALGGLTGLGMALVHVRPSRTVMQIVEERTKDDVKIVLRILAEERAEDARKMEEWKNETIAELYAAIMDQVERGVISCNKCKENGTAHFAGRHGEQPVPEPRHAEDISKPCECGGPTSIRVIHPSRFQPRRTAS
jgi:hypothetical protein